ncbi:TRAP transporter substrate-binding protein [Acuticoccus sp. M5D2P5]|uniref:TRAP transporter substrate-binding protein n=1 Tax=Acuticoccus kalidii TaxID=2910977 RepID=UPI001F345496|nr:TRAP transporter substrate-binding protein [Acuticoccus kalidii]MCF3933441.1 TRAP transporter substrate-binding protein [Acuticoccus kalidii]
MKLPIALTALLATTAVAAAQDYTVRLGHAQSTTDVFHIGAQTFKEELEAATDGQVEVIIYPSSQLGNIRDMIEGLRIGTVQVVLDAPSRLATYTPLGDLFKVPYLFDAREDGEAMWNSPGGAEVIDTIAGASGIRVIGVAWRGARHITSNREINTPEDLQGLKIRVPPTDLPVAMFEHLGASPTPMDFNEVYLALQQGIIDAQENPLTTNWTNNFQEVTEYLVLTGHVKDFAGFMTGEDWFQSLPEDIQQATLDAALAASKVIGDYVIAEEDNFVEKFREAGLTVIEPDQEAFKAKFDGFMEEFNPELAKQVETLKSSVTQD